MEQSQADKYIEAAKKWCTSKANTQKIKYVSKNEKERQLTFEFGKDELKFVITYPEKGDDMWQVSSDELSSEFEGFTNGTKIDEALKFATSQYTALSDEEFSGGSGDEEGEDAFDEEVFAPIEVSDKPKEKPEPEIDTSKFKIPVGYEPAAVMAIVKQLQSIMAMSWEEKEYEAGPVNDHISQWEVKLYGIPKDEPLWADMKQMGIEYITMHVLFPPDFPFSAPFIRVLRPRFAFRTGHVTVGGAICTLLLTNEGWKPNYRLQQILVDIRAMFTSGGGRLDTGNRSDYSEAEAMDAFRRLLATHGWTHWKK